MHCDIIVVGGGIVTRAVADALAQQGATVACVYRRDRAPGQASAAAGAMLSVFSEVSAHDDAERRRLQGGRTLAGADMLSGMAGPAGPADPGLHRAAGGLPRASPAPAGKR